MTNSFSLNIGHHVHRPSTSGFCNAPSTYNLQGLTRRKKEEFALFSRDRESHGECHCSGEFALREWTVREGELLVGGYPLSLLTHVLGSRGFGKESCDDTLNRIGVGLAGRLWGWCLS